MKILVLRFSSIGDIVLTSPVLRCLKSQIPDAEIHFATKSQFVSILAANPHVAKVHTLSEDFSDMLREFKAEKFDYIIDLHNNLRTLRISMALLSVPCYRFRKLNLRKWWYVLTKQKVMPEVHIVHRYMEACKPLGVEYDDQGLDWFGPESFTGAVQLPQHFVAFAVGGTYATKRMPLNKMREILAYTTCNFVLLGDRQDAERIKPLLDEFSPRVQSLCGSCSLLDSALVLQRSDIVITHDTGLMHIAAAIRKPVISIWGNTVPDFGMYPLFPRGMDALNVHMANVPDLSCRPCSKLGFEKCPKGHFRCMEQQNTAHIASFLG
ncbi:MAG: glycosyltransferase family 9 protein [Bacteroidetes bacterium]|nr:glycosyltransferase family 9 protein [Bacteroidota bacterium]